MFVTVVERTPLTNEFLASSIYGKHTIALA